MRKALTAVLLLTWASMAWGGIIFSDDFDSYADQAAYEATWLVDPLYSSAPLSTEQAHSGLQSIKTPNAANNQNFNYRNLGINFWPSDDEPLIATFWLYDQLAATRQFNSIRDYTGAGYKDGDLDQIYATGIYNTVSAPGEVHDATKYHARVAFGSGAGWFNLNAPGCPNRSTGWHKFTIEVNSTVANFYVDDILGRSWSRGTITAFDSVGLGSLLSSASTAVWTDDFTVTPEPAALVLLALGTLVVWRRRA
jgi:MYXO-CTERM domain-containing protein